MESPRYTPQEAATVAELALPVVQKAITSKQLPAELFGKPPRRKIDELSLLALALAHRLPKKVALTIAEARRRLEEQHITSAKDARTHLIVGGTVRVDLAEVLGPVLHRLQLFQRAQSMITAPMEGGDAVITGTKIRPDEIRDRLARGEPKEKLHADFPLLDVETIEAIALWADATPRRGRPKKRSASSGAHLPVARDISTWTRTMQITSQQIDGWAHGEAARPFLPLLVRRLINTAGSITQIAFPGRDSTNLPGWDGQLVSEMGSPWVPKGQSYWELSCEDNPTSKANGDYERRTGQTPKPTRRNSTYVAVTARRWPQKKKWVEAKRASKEWSDVRAYDADDLEQMLEVSPAVALWFADELGLAGHGVESPTRFWEVWAEQSAPALTTGAIFAARDDKRKGLVEDIRKRFESGSVEPLLVTADSVGEAVAFVCAAISAEADMAASALVVTDNTGWKFVEQNHVLKIAIAARTEIAESPARRTGLVVVIPYAVGDFPAQFRGIAGRQVDAIAFELPRPRSHEFEEALVGIGIDKSDAKRLASSTGRSWSVYRRHKAVNPALRSPAWLERQQSRALSTLCLLGSWSGGNAADKQIVSRVANRAYEDLERDLRELSTMDDAPVLAIGQVWKAKSPLELLDLYGQHIPSAEVERFLDCAKEILTAEDPQLDLEEDKRYAAAIYGKVRPETGLLRDAICDTLVKLAVMGPEISSLAGLHIDARIGRFVHDLLNDATPRRWLSLASYLPHLAEAAPDQFLRAIEASLAAPGAPVTQLIAETTSAGITGRCWHSGLLWALERLAWAPNRVRKVALVLARLCHVPFKSNWANTPLASLNGIFRTWLPQTAATVDQRIGHLDALIAQEPDIAFSLLERMVNLGHDVATPSARPEWRDDDAGAGHGVTRRDHAAMLIAAADRLLSSATGNAGRVAKVISHIEQLGLIDGIDKPNPSRVERAMALVEGYASETASDEDRETVRTQLRERIYWHRNYGDGKRLPLASVNSMDGLYARLAPRDPVVRNRWLFEKSWLNLPMRVRDDDYTARSGTVQSLRKKALAEILSAQGLSGVKALLEKCPTSTEIGISLAEQGLDVTTLANWIVSASQDVSWNDPMRAAVQGLLRSTDSVTALEIVRTVLDVGRNSRWPQENLVNFLAAARDERSTWDVVASCGEDIEKAYWDTSRPGFWIRDNANDFQFVLRKLIEAKRPRTALQVCHMDFDKVEPLLLADMLEGMLRGEEKDGPLLRSWDIANAIKRLERPGALPQDRLIRLEFGLVPTLGYQGEQKARALYRALLEQPEMFVQLLCLIYKAENAEKRLEEDVSEGERNAAHIAWDVLHHCRRLPGWIDSGSGQVSAAQQIEPDDDDDESPPTKQVAGRIDPVTFHAFVREARQLATAEGRGKVCDITLGQIMAYAPADDDGTWPCLPVRDFLEGADCEEARNGFSTGTYNRRGVHWRSMDDGGGQERELAKTYRGYARAIVDTHPTLAATLDGIARGYDNEALREDLDARLRVEGN